MMTKLASILQSSRALTHKDLDVSEAAVISMDFSAFIQFESVFETLREEKNSEKFKYTRKLKYFKQYHITKSKKKKLRL